MIYGGSSVTAGSGARGQQLCPPLTHLLTPRLQPSALGFPTVWHRAPPRSGLCRARAAKGGIKSNLCSWLSDAEHCLRRRLLARL